MYSELSCDLFLPENAHFFIEVALLPPPALAPMQLVQVCVTQNEIR